MMDLKKGTTGIATHRRDAVEWFVENGADHELNEKSVLKWEKWCTNAWNNTAYVGVVRMCLEIPLLPAPRLASREELLRDALAEGDTES